MNHKPIPRLFLRLLLGLIHITIVFIGKLRIFPSICSFGLLGWIYSVLVLNNCELCGSVIFHLQVTSLHLVLLFGSLRTEE